MRIVKRLSHFCVSQRDKAKRSKTYFVVGENNEKIRRWLTMKLIVRIKLSEKTKQMRRIATYPLYFT